MILVYTIFVLNYSNRNSVTNFFGFDRYRGLLRCRLIDAQALRIQLHLARLVGSFDVIVIKKARGGFGFAFDFPDGGIRDVVGFFRERRDERRAEPLDAVVGLGGEVAVVERDHVSAFVAAVAGFFGVGAAVPVEREQVLAPFPAAVAKLHPHARFGEPVEHGAGDLAAETVPELEPVERLRRGVGPMAEGVDREPPDDRPVFGQHVKAEGPAGDRGRAEDADLEKLPLVRIAVVEKLFAQMAVEARDVRVECGQFGVFTSRGWWE